MLISAMAIATLKIELISKSIFSKSNNHINANIKDIINIGSYEDLMEIKNILTLKNDSISLDDVNISFLHISLKENNESSYARFRMFYGR